MELDMPSIPSIRSREPIPISRAGFKDPNQRTHSLLKDAASLTLPRPPDPVHQYANTNANAGRPWYEHSARSSTTWGKHTDADTIDVIGLTILVPG